VKGAVIAFLFLLVIFIATAPELPIVPEPNKTVKFVFATWDHPDQYGQGIDGFRLYENSTGSWEPAWFSWGYYVEHDDSEHEVFVWNASIFIMLRVWSTINATLVGASDADEGENYHRHNVTVTDRADVTVFEQQNFTYVNGVEGWLYEPFDDLLYYEYTIVLNFLPLPLEVYTVSVLYEVFW
jgi:hypothetical protein